MAANIEMVISDLDGTLLRSDGSISNKDVQTLQILGDKGIIRAIATGRSIYSFNKVISADLPIDYLIFSSGAGILDWRRDRIVKKAVIPPNETASIAEALLKEKLNFMIQAPIPDNHRFVYYRDGVVNPDFDRRLRIYRDFAEPLNFSPRNFTAASQFLSILPESASLMEMFRELFPGHKIIRATSPLDHQSLWIEIFPATVSKALAAEWICRQEGIEPEATMAVGNDYNDLDLLAWTPHAFAVENACSSLKRKYRVTGSNEQSGFSAAVTQMTGL